jgi:hypothetical protein
MKHNTPVAARPGAASGSAIKRNPLHTPQPSLFGFAFVTETSLIAG